MHSAYAFGHESLVAKSNIDSKQVPPGALISFIQKGLQYVEMEAHINEDGSESMCDGSFSVLTEHSCNTLKRKQIFDPYEPIQITYGDLEIDDDMVWTLRGHSKMVTIVLWHPLSLILTTGSLDRSLRFWDFEAIRKGIEEGTSEDEEENKEKKSSSDPNNHVIVCAIPEREARVAESGSTDPVEELSETTEDEDMSERKNQPRGNSKQTKPSILRSERNASSGRDGPPQKKRKGSSGSGIPSSSESGVPAELSGSVVSACWNTEGNMFACGDYDGGVSIWSESGTLMHSYQDHSQPVTCLRWNSAGSYLLSGSIDGTLCVWDVKAAKLHITISESSAPILDCDWRSDSDFASSNADGSISRHSISSAFPSQPFNGHTGEVHAVRWCPQGQLLASCGEDKTVKLWNLSSTEAIASANSHTKGIICLSWSNTGAGTENPELPLMLATGSLDATVRVWDVRDGVLRCVQTLKQHTHPVIALSFAPYSQPDLLASAAHDRVHVWSVRDGTIVKTFRAPEGGINSINWHSGGQQLAAGLSDGSVYVLDLRR